MKYLAIISVFALCISCYQNIEIELPEHEPKLVLNSLIKAGDSLRLYLTYSQDPLNNDAVIFFVPDAVITIKINGLEIGSNFTLDHYNRYVSGDYIAQPGDHVQLEVSANGYPPVRASTIIPGAPTLSSAYLLGTKVSLDGGEQEMVRLKMTDKQNESNFYEVVLLQADSSSNPQPSVYYSGFTLYPTESWQEATESGIAFPDFTFQGKTGTIDFSYFQGIIYCSESMKNYVELRTVSEEYYDYMTTIAAHIENQEAELFSGEPVPMYSNVEGGFGFVGAFSYSRMEVDLPGCD